MATDHHRAARRHFKELTKEEILMIDVKETKPASLIKAEENGDYGSLESTLVL